MRISFETDKSIGDFPSLFLANKVGCLVNKNLRLSWWPYSAQKCAGVLPSTSFEFVSAPASTRI